MFNYEILIKMIYLTVETKKGARSSLKFITCGGQAISDYTIDWILSALVISPLAFFFSASRECVCLNFGVNALVDVSNWCVSIFIVILLLIRNKRKFPYNDRKQVICYSDHNQNTTYIQPNIHITTKQNVGNWHESEKDTNTLSFVIYFDKVENIRVFGVNARVFVDLFR